MCQPSPSSSNTRSNLSTPSHSPSGHSPSRSEIKLRQILAKDPPSACESDDSSDCECHDLNYLWRTRGLVSQSQVGDHRPRRSITPEQSGDSDVCCLFLSFTLVRLSFALQSQSSSPSPGQSSGPSTPSPPHSPLMSTRRDHTHNPHPPPPRTFDVVSVAAMCKEKTGYVSFLDIEGLQLPSEDERNHMTSWRIWK